ncbi:MAG: tetratricopeptide repeat protein, partial [Acidobacteriota bacterium]|nr:tetratricopeptide repeat protein [Acidobacteriota bacterium]
WRLPRVALAMAAGVQLVACGAAGGDKAEAADPAARATELTARAEKLFATRASKDLIAAFELYRQARVLDPKLARAHAGTATIGCLLALYSIEVPVDVLPLAQRAAEDALRLEPELAEAVGALGLVDYLYHWRFERAEERFLAAARLDPTLATVDHWRGMLLMAQGRFGEAVEAYDRALAKDPASELYRTKRATILAHAGRRDEAYAELTAVADENTGYSLVWREIGFLAIDDGRVEEAVTAFERAAALDGGASKSTGGLGYAWARVGRREEARGVLDDFLNRSADLWVSPMYLAMMHGGLGEADAAFRELRRAISVRDPGVVYLGVKSGFDELRDDPRFTEMLREIGLK